jgi:hypothetical protein
MTRTNKGISRTTGSLPFPGSSKLIEEAAALILDQVYKSSPVLPFGTSREPQLPRSSTLSVEVLATAKHKEPFPNRRMVTLDKDLILAFRGIHLEGMGPCYTVRDAAASEAGAALVTLSGRLDVLLTQLVALHQAALGIALANRLPTEGLVATSEAWMRRIRSVKLGALSSSVERFFDPTAWDLFHFEVGQIPEIFWQALGICKAAQVPFPKAVILNKLRFLGYGDAAQILEERISEALGGEIRPRRVTTVGSEPRQALPQTHPPRRRGRGRTAVI